MNGFSTMLKCNLRLLLRNKGYLISVIGIPLLATLWIWFIQYSSTVTTTASEDTSITKIHIDDKVLHPEDSLSLAVKVYDASHSKASEYFINTLSEYSMFSFYLADASGMTEEEIRKNAECTANTSNLFTSLYVPSDFEELMLTGTTDTAIVLYKTTEDDRAKLLGTNSQALLTTISRYGNLANHDKDAFYKLLTKAGDIKITRELTTVSNTELTELTREQKEQKNSFGYVLAFFILSFLLSGVFISSIYVSEKNNNVLKRITLTKANFFNYIVVKLILAVITLIIEETVICIGISIMGNILGLTTPQFIFITSGVGLILLLLSIVIGTYTNNVVTVAFGGFFAWTISNCLAGLYFPISENSLWLQSIAKLMPQYWSMEYYDLIQVGNGGGILMYLAVTLAFLALLGCLGVLGLRLTSKK